MRRFESAGRFWEIGINGYQVHMKWGPIGTPGQTFTRLLLTLGEAEEFAERQILAQRDRGYVEITNAQPIVVSPDVTVERHQRFESLERYVEITQEGVKITERGGRIVGGHNMPDRDQLWVKHYSSVATASAAFDERCANARELGGRAIDPEPTHAVHSNTELEAQCEAARDAPDAWAVYADWLIAHNDARGEIAALQLAGKVAEAKRVLGTHLRELCGIDTGKLAFEYRHGFAVGCTIGIDRESEDPLEDITRMVLASPMGRFLEALRFGLAGQGEENDWGPTIHAVAASPRAAHIRALRFDHYGFEDSEISWTPFGDFTGVWPKLPALELLHIRSGAGGTLGALDLPRLKTFIRESGGLAASEIDEIHAARWPALEHLEIWFGSNQYGAEGELASVKPFLDGKGVPALRHLGICNCEFIDSVIPELARSKILPRLHSLDLSKGVMARTATAALVANAAAFRHLAAIDLDSNLLLEDELAQIREVLDNVIPGRQRSRDYNDDDDVELDRYVAVGE